MATDWTRYSPSPLRTGDDVAPEWAVRGATRKTPKGVAAKTKPVRRGTARVRNAGDPRGKDYALSALGVLSGLSPGSMERQVDRAAVGTGKFLSDAGNRQMLLDLAREVPGALWSGGTRAASNARQDPLGALGGALGGVKDFILDSLPGAEVARSVRAGARLRAAGKPAEALDIEQEAVPLEALNFLPLGAAGVGAKRAAKAGTKAAKAGAKAAVEGAEKLAAGAKKRLAPSGPRYERSMDGEDLIVRRKGAVPQIVPEAQGATLSQIRALLADPGSNQPARLADEYAQRELGRKYDVNFPAPGTGLSKQGGIARAFQLGAEEHPDYKRAIFERYGQVMPQVVEQAGAQNYDQLTEAAYLQLAKEARQQFDTLPVSMRYHDGSGEYAAPSAMLRDILGSGNLNVFRGGDPHPYLSTVDKDTGLTANEMFRADHDYYGHGTRGTTFRPGGEEVAYASHSQMMSPLAQMALAAETRGQNSLVNYSPLNTHILREQNALRNLQQERDWAERFVRGERTAEDKLRGTPWPGHAEMALHRMRPRAEINAKLQELAAQTRYAPQTPLLLPPEHLDPMTSGGLPDYLMPVSAANQQAASAPMRGVHFSKLDDLTATDPAFFGTGHRGKERESVLSDDRRPLRSYFYLGDEGTVNPEQVVFNEAPHAYEARLPGLYDINHDPQGLVELARAYAQPNWTSDYGSALDPAYQLQAGTANNSLIPNMEKLIREYGYPGFKSDAYGGSAALYGPVEGLRPISRRERGYATGGLVRAADCVEVPA